MNFDEFTGQVQNRLQLPSTGEAVRATRATLQTLAERLQPGEAEDLAGPLPMEIDRFLLDADSGQRFGWQEFVDRVAERENAPDPDDRADVVYHARVIVQLLHEVVPAGEFQQVRDQLPEDEDWDELFELVDQEDTGARNQSQGQGQDGTQTSE